MGKKKSPKDIKLQKTLRYLNVINAFATGFLETNTVDEIVWMVARQAIGKLGYEDCVVYLFDEKREFLIQRAAYGPKNPIDFDIHHPIKLKPGLGIVGHVANTGIGEIVRDASKDDRYYLDDESRNSEITVPIIANSKVIGIIDSEHSKIGFYTSEDLEILTTIASMTSSRLSQAFAIEKLNEHQSKLEERVKNKTSELRETLSQLTHINIELKTRNQEKEILLKEVHHRVKNNMQIITSLLSLQSLNIDDKETKNLFSNSQHRINSMALVHEMLYQTDNLSKINYSQYLRQLINNLVTLFKGKEHNITTKIDVPNIYFNMDTAIPLGILINEIITNSLKYAFIQNDTGILTLKIKNLKKKHKYSLEIGDNGPGFSVNTDISDQKSLGMQLIYKLAKQIKGEIKKIKRKKGTHYILTFEDV
jgi:two-component sensor histidine kinase/putative methionine-R-sulfoxide reductase with GAF domain